MDVPVNGRVILSILHLLAGSAARFLHLLVLVSIVTMFSAVAKESLRIDGAELLHHLTRGHAPGLVRRLVLHHQVDS